MRPRIGVDLLGGLCQTNFGPPSGVIVWGMTNPFRYFNSSPEVIRLVVMMYVRYPLSLRNAEDLLAERGIDISYETVRFWWNRFGPMFVAEIRKKRVAHMRGYTQWGGVRANSRAVPAVLASAHEQSVPIFQQLARGHPSGRDDVRAIPAVAAQR